MTSKYSSTIREIKAEHPDWTNNRIAREMGVDHRTVDRAEAGARANVPPIEPVPPGFHLSSIATTVDAYGKTRSQSFKAKSGDEGDVVPESGSFPAPDGMFVRSVSTLVDGQTGIVKQQWVKADIIAKEKFEAQIRGAVAGALAELPPYSTVQAPIATIDELCTVYTLTDCHVGMLAWGRETGEPWDLPIAEKTLLDAFQQMVLSSPPAKTCIVNELGDFLHFDSLRPLTPEHGNILDADSRYQKIVEIAVKILRATIDMALLKHEIVYVDLDEGNHDPAGSVWLRVMFAHLYENNPRVIVNTSPSPYVMHMHGKTMLCFHHGHLSQKENLPQLFAGMYRKEWGESTYTYIHTGHKHESVEFEKPGVKVIQHPTLAAKDAYAARGGWLSKRQATAITYHSEFGEYCRNTVIPKDMQ